MMFLSYSNEPRWRNLVALDIKEYVNLHVSIAMQKDSEFAELFDHHIIEMQESGLLNRIRHRWIYKANQDYGMAEPASLSIQNIMFVFACIAFGIVLAAYIILAEWFCKKCLKMEAFPGIARLRPRPALVATTTSKLWSNMKLWSRISKLMVATRSWILTRIYQGSC